MSLPSAFILPVPEHRREVILSATEDAFGERRIVTEPVVRFDHSKDVPLVVLASFTEGLITHVADGRKGATAGTGLVRLNMKDLQELQQPLEFEAVLQRMPKKLRQHLARRLSTGGKLPPKTLGALVDVLMSLDEALVARLQRFSANRAQRLKRLSSREQENLAYQKEALGVALDIAGLDKEELLSWSPSPTTPRSFLDGLQSVHVREDAMLATDFSNLPGFNAIAGATHFAARTFVDPRAGGNRLRVIMANRLALEEQTGADLIYYSETYRSFVMVQYKAMEHGGEGPEFRWRDGDDLAREIARMGALQAELAKAKPDAHPNAFRLSPNPFFLKFCPRVTFDPDNKGLFKGIYLPLDLWACLDNAKHLMGPKGGKLLTFRNVGRYLTNAEFVVLVSKSWVGTTVNQSAILEDLIRQVLSTGKTVTYAVQDVARPADGFWDGFADSDHLVDEEID